MKKLIRICSVIALMIGIVSCGEKRPKTYRYYINPQIWYAINLWDSSSYWIMQDSATGKLDSLYTYQHSLASNDDGSSDYSDHHVWEVATNGIIDYSGVDTFAFMGLYVPAYNTTYNMEITSLEFYFFKKDTINSNYYYGYSYKHDNVISVPSKNPFTWHELWYDSSYTIHPIFGSSFNELLPTYTINNQTYDSVYHVHSTAPDSLLQLNDDFYYNHKHGILKIVQNNARIKRTLLLVRDHLIKE